jgi:cytochrome P450 family 110
MRTPNTSYIFCSLSIPDYQFPMTQLPDGPTLHPTLQLVQWVANPLGYLEENTRRYGDVFTARLGGNLQPFVFFSHPQAIQEILTADAQQFDAGRMNGILRHLVGDTSILLLDGEPHKQQRKLMMPPFYGDRMLAYGQFIVDTTRAVMSRQSVGKAFSVRAVTQEITMRAILQIVFGLDEGERYPQVHRLMTDLLNRTGSPLQSSLLFFPVLQRDWGEWSPWGRFLRQREQLDRLLYAEIEERRSQVNGDRTDAMTLLLAARDDRGKAMSPLEIRDELITLLLAGHETTATALAWALYWVHKLPDVKARLLEELAGLGDRPDPLSLVKLPYLNAVCQETLRIYPVALLAFPRRLNFDATVMGYKLSQGTVLAPCIYLTHQREDLYANAKQFNPDRFLERQYSPYEFYPFGGGNRRCLGMALAQYEMKLALATILSDWQLALPDNRSIKPARRGVTVAPSGNLKLVKLDRQARLTRSAARV